MSDKWSGDGKQEGQRRDTDVRVEGPVVNQLRAFVENWRVATGVLLGGRDTSPPTGARRRVESRSCGARPRGAAGRVTMFLLAWRRRGGLLHHEPVLRSRRADDGRAGPGRAARGAGGGAPPRQDGPRARPTRQPAPPGRLLQSGVQIFEYRAALLHPRPSWSTPRGAASAAPTWTAARSRNEELNLIVYDAGVAGQLEQVFERDVQHRAPCDICDLGGAQPDPPTAALLGRAAGPRPALG